MHFRVKIISEHDDPQAVPVPDLTAEILRDKFIKMVQREGVYYNPFALVLRVLGRRYEKQDRKTQIILSICPVLLVACILNLTLDLPVLIETAFYPIAIALGFYFDFKYDLGRRWFYALSLLNPQSYTLDDKEIKRVIRRFYIELIKAQIKDSRYLFAGEKVAFVGISYETLYKEFKEMLTISKKKIPFFTRFYLGFVDQGKLTKLRLEDETIINMNF